MFRSKSSRLALMAFAFALPVILGERAPAPEQATAKTIPAESGAAPESIPAPATTA